MFSGDGEVSDIVLFNIIAFPYYGWFYSQRGASFGKIVMGLKVIDVQTGERLSYWRGFIRETLGKYISLAIGGLGFALIFFRRDHRALHDLIFETTVLIEPVQSRP